LGSIATIKIGQPNQTCRRTKWNKRQKLWIRGDNLTQAHPKQCKEILCIKPAASSDPENSEEGILLEDNPYSNWGASTQHSSNKPTPQREEAELVKPPNINLYIVATTPTRGYKVMSSSQS
jgi:hypothetical protein